jgi:DNA-binding beta-propeller fold protein YncE
MTTPEIEPESSEIENTPEETVKPSATPSEPVAAVEATPAETPAATPEAPEEDVETAAAVAAIVLPEVEAQAEEIPQHPGEEEVEKDERKRRSLLLLLLFLLLCLCCVGGLFLRYLMKPQPLPEMVPVVENINYPPTYKFSFPAERPVGVAVSPDGQRIYVAESAGEYAIKIFDRDGVFIKSFGPPFTDKANRAPTYIAIDSIGRVYVTDTYNDTIAVFDPDGNFIDGIVQRDTTISELVAADNGGSIPSGTQFYFNKISMSVEYLTPGQERKRIPVDQDNWSPVGLRFDKHGNLMVTNFVVGFHEVLIYPAEALSASWLNFDPQVKNFGVYGSEAGQLSFPNSVVVDSKGNYYVSDGNNARISTWTPDLQYSDFFGFASDAESTLNLPRGMWMDGKDHLHVTDAVGQFIRVYDVSGTEATFLFNIGAFGDQEGEFNFPTDICIDGTGRLYIADRENNRIQVWSY